MTRYVRIRRKSKESKKIRLLPEGGNSSKSGDDRIGQVFANVVPGSIGFQRVAVLAIG